MRPSSTIFTLLLASASLAAQTATGNNPTLLVKPPVSRTCPVLFSVDRAPSTAIIRTNGAPTPRGQGLNLTFANPATHIVSADITVHFYVAAAHAIPAAPSASNAAPLTETFHLTSSAENPMHQSSLWTRHTAPITWVELTHLDYADGTSWQPSTPRQCAVAPNLFVLVDSAR
jgi:hypothetical protein